MLCLYFYLFNVEVCCTLFLCLYRDDEGNIRETVGGQMFWCMDTSTFTQVQTPVFFFKFLSLFLFVGDLKSY